jgi:FtsP/CotA-like multicopper oxidase with cupredoxin domain
VRHAQSSQQTTREYTFDIAPAAAAPDGYPRQIYAVNNQFPGPLIEANEGDWVVVHVNNHLNIGQTIHWHGLLQNGTAYMDGIPGISQVSSTRANTNVGIAYGSAPSRPDSRSLTSSA